MEEAEALDRLMKEESYTQEQLGAIIGKAQELGDMMPHRVPQFPSRACPRRSGTSAAATRP